MSVDPQHKAALHAQNLHVAEIASTPQKNAGGILVAGEVQAGNKFLTDALALYAKNYVIAGEGETPEIIRKRLAGHDRLCPEMKVVALLDGENKVCGVSFFEQYNVGGKTAWLNTYAITDDQFKGNEIVSKAFHHGAAEAMHNADIAAGREPSLVVAEVNSTHGFRKEMLEHNQKFADTEWMIKTGEPAEARETYIVNGEARILDLSNNRVAIQAPYTPPNLAELEEQYKGASASQLAHLVANQPLMEAQAGENTGAEPLFLISYKTDSSKFKSHDLKTVHNLMGTELPVSVITANSEGIVSEKTAREILTNHRKIAGYADMDKAFDKIHAETVSKEQKLPASPPINIHTRNTEAEELDKIAELGRDV